MKNKFNIIYTDCPWQYTDKALAGNRGAECKYPVINIEEIKRLPINEISADDSILFCWATWPLIQEALDAIKAWGFTYKTVGFNWIKLNKKAPTPFMGMGNWTRSNSEVCLIGVKGKPKRVSASVHSVLITEDEWETEDIFVPIEGHSKKPDIIRSKIVDLCGDLPRIELFAREETDGWISVGNDIDGQDIRGALKDIINE